jgi:hypothetical protein
MTKFRIFAPSGVEVCTIEADSKVITPERTIFYEAPTDIRSCHEILTDIPSGWVAIPEDAIVKEGNKKHVDERVSFEDVVTNNKLIQILNGDPEIGDTVLMDFPGNPIGIIVGFENSCQALVSYKSRVCLIGMHLLSKIKVIDDQ